MKKTLSPRAAWRIMRSLALLCVAAMVSVPIRATLTQPYGTVFHLICTANGQAVTNGNTDNISQQYLTTAQPDASLQGQDWILHPISASTGVYVLVNPNYGTAMDMASEAGSNAYHLLQWTCEPANTNQQFRIKAVDGQDGVYQLLDTLDTRAMTLRDGGLYMDTDLSSSNSYFRLEATGRTAKITTPWTGFTYVVTSQLTGKVVTTLGSGGSGARLYASDDRDDDVPAQRWQLKSAKDDNGTAHTVLYNDTYRLAVDAALNNVKYPLLYDLNAGNVNQQVSFRSVSGQEGVYQIYYTYQWQTYYMTTDEKGDMSMTTSSGDAGTYFTFEALTPIEVKPRQKNDWENELVYAEGKEEGHATYMPYASTEELRADGDRYARPWLDPQSSRVMSLNGTWKINWVDDPEKRPGEAEFYADDADVSEWDDIKVPSCVEMKGYGDPWYINVNYGWSDEPPYITMLDKLYNSVSSFRRDFTLPEGWEDQRVFLHFDGLYSGAYVWVNGQKVGYTEGSNNDAEFDVTAYVRQGANNVSVQVFRFTDGSYLEGQDMWHMSGIHRDVYLFATPKTYVRDHFITAELDESSDYKSGAMKVELTMTRKDGDEQADKQVKVTLLSPEGQEIQSQTASFSFPAQADVVETTQTLTFSGLNDLQLWSAENPVLYTVEIAQLDASGNEEEAFATKYGFRHVEIENGLVYVNGQKVYFKGVNTQDTHPLEGRAIDVETMLRDITLMKQANVNTVRTSHYPRQAKMYAMFDYYGIYTMDEADVECHKNWSDNNSGSKLISNMASWQGQFIDRTQRMVLRDRNFPSVIFWSLGNESGFGTNHVATYNLCKQLDPQRIVHYEGCTNDGSSSATDIWSRMYPNMNSGSNMPSNEANYNRYQQPYFMCEYAHAMGNGVGNLQEFWDILESSTYGIGGCIWDWVDQSIVSADDQKQGQLTLNGYNKYSTGYDWPDAPHQGNFVNNGIITADRAWTSKLTEVKRVYQYVKFSDFNADSRQLTIKNAYNFTSLDNFYLKYTVLEDGEAVESGNVELPALAPDASTTITLPYTTEAGQGETMLNIEVCQKEESLVAEADYAVATAQFTIQERSATLPDVEIADTDPVLAITQEGGKTVVSNDKVNLTFASDGQLEKWTAEDVQILADNGGPEYANYRWIENDEHYGVSDNYSTSNGITRHSMTSSLSADKKTATVSVTGTGSRCNYVFDYTIYANGTVDLEATYTVTGSSLRRIGMGIEFPGEYSYVSYYARGPWANYIDRQTGSYLGRYTTTVDDMREHWVRPQSMGNRQDLRELTLLNPDTRKGFRVQTEGQVAFSTLYYSDEQLKEKDHNWELALPESLGERTIYAHFDWRQKGLGNGSCSPEEPMTKYQLPSSGTYSYTLRFTPVTDGIVDGIGQTSADNPENLRIAHSEESLTLTGHLAAGTHIALYNLGGVRLASAMLAADAESFSLPLSEYPRGSYLVVVDNESGSRTHKFVK